ncbi:MAG: hypothetical protein II943_07395 [Victivallales bacterium]|nr:hypothetical protein [Victivallales bacterium]
MRKYWSFLLLYFVGMVMALAFLFQLRLRGGAIFAVQWWPVLIAGFLCGAAFCLGAGRTLEKMVTPIQKEKFYFMRHLPGDLFLKTTALISLGLSPFWCWTNSGASLSPHLNSYFTGMLFLSVAVMIMMVISFARHLRVLAVCIGGSDGLVQRLNLAVRGWLYFFLVPMCAIVIGSNRVWHEMMAQPDLSYGLLVQMLKFQIVVISFSWIGTVVAWIVLLLLAWEVVVAFELLLQFNHYLKVHELQTDLTNPVLDAVREPVSAKTDALASEEGETISVSAEDTGNHE